MISAMAPLVKATKPLRSAPNPAAEATPIERSVRTFAPGGAVTLDVSICSSRLNSPGLPAAAMMFTESFSNPATWSASWPLMAAPPDWLGTLPDTKPHESPQSF